MDEDNFEKEIPKNNLQVENFQENDKEPRVGGHALFGIMLFESAVEDTVVCKCTK